MNEPTQRNPILNFPPTTLVKVIIAGGRKFEDYGFMCRCMDGIKSVYYDRPIEVISGHAKGADRLGERWAEDHGFEVDKYKPDYAQFGRWRAPKIRNMEMAKVGHVLAAFWDGESTGTQHMIMTAIRESLEVHIYRYE